MKSGIEYFEVVEGNIKAEKCTGDFGGPNMWKLCIKNVKNNRGWYKQVQWMDVSNIQEFFETVLPVYEEKSNSVYQLQKHRL
jgi:hypothetical protein